MNRISQVNNICQMSVATSGKQLELGLQNKQYEICKGSKQKRVKFEEEVSIGYTISRNEMLEDEKHNTWYTTAQLEMIFKEAETFASTAAQRVRPGLTIVKAYRCLRKNIDVKGQTKAEELLSSWNKDTVGLYRGLEQCVDNELTEMMLSSQCSHNRKVLGEQRKWKNSGKSCKGNDFCETLRQISENESKYSREYARLLATMDSVSIVPEKKTVAPVKSVKKVKIERKVPSWKDLKKNMFRKRVVAATSA